MGADGGVQGVEVAADDVGALPGGGGLVVGSLGADVGETYADELGIAGEVGGFEAVGSAVGAGFVDCWGWC